MYISIPSIYKTTYANCSRKTSWPSPILVVWLSCAHMGKYCPKVQPKHIAYKMPLSVTNSISGVYCRKWRVTDEISRVLGSYRSLGHFTQYIYMYIYIALQKMKRREAVKYIIALDNPYTCCNHPDFNGYYSRLFLNRYIYPARDKTLSKENHYGTSLTAKCDISVTLNDY